MISWLPRMNIVLLILELRDSDLSQHIRQNHIQHHYSNQSNLSITALTLCWVVCTSTMAEIMVLEPKSSLNLSAAIQHGDVLFKYMCGWECLRAPAGELIKSCLGGWGPSSLEKGVERYAKQQQLSMLFQWAHSAVCLQNRLALARG